ncbi:MAG: hypothetical protein BHV77_10105 [Bacteroides sp. 43_108]|nr:MAG: hypothetical protein BHV77_10105 [Bacteroides sp. 43_108]
MRLLNKLAYALCAVALLSSCGDDDEYSRGEYPLDGYENISLPGTVNIEIEPTEPTTYTVEVSRVNTEGEATMPVEITDNTDDVFTVEPVVFKDGESKSVMTINFPNAEVGKSYHLALKVTDKNFTSPYDQANYLDLTVSRVKWNNVGYVNDEEGNIYCEYYDDFMTGLYGISGDLTTYIQVQERDDKPGYFRLVDPYRAYAKAMGSYDEDGAPHYMYIDATDPKKVYMPSLFDSGMTLDPNYGSLIMWDMAGYYLARNDEASAAQYYGKYENGRITYPKGALLVGESLDPEGGLYPANNTGNGAFYLQITQPEVQYVADPRYDFDWEELFSAGQYTSEILGYNGTAAVSKGTCYVTTDGCDTIFANTYGDLYKITNPYGTNADIYFTVKNGVVGVPGADFAAQATGITVFGQNVYARINSDESSFSEKLINLNITYTNEDGSIEYGSGVDVISNITYSEWGQGIFTYNGLYGGQGLVQISKRDDAEVYRLHDLFEEGYDIDFTWNRETNEVAMEPQYVCEMQGFKVGVMDLESSGLADMAVEEGYVEDPRSYYDPATNTFYFTTIYVDLLSGQVLGDESGPLIGDKETLEVVSTVENGKLRTVSLGDSFKKVAKTAKASSVRKFGKKVNGVGLTPKKAGKASMSRKNNLVSFANR